MIVRAKDQSGAVLIIITLLLLAIFSIAALAIDIAQYSNTLTQARNNGNLAALTALEEFMASRSTSAALARAQAVLSYNSTFANPGPAQLTTSVNSNGAQLSAGNWFYARPANSNPCNGAYPCFVPLPDGSPAAPNAFRVSGNLYPPMPFNFARVFGTGESPPIAVNSTASIVPRHGCFLVSISPTTFSRETHLRNESESAYFLTNPPDNAGVSSYHDTEWAGMGAARPAGPPSNSTTHYQSDYNRTSDLFVTTGGILDNSNYNASPDYAKFHPSPTVDNNRYSSPDKPVYRVDMFPSRAGDTGGSYLGPQPMTRILAGLKTAISGFRTRSVAGDQMCLIFYDQSLRWMRIVNLTDDFNYLSKFADMSDPNNLRRIYQHRIFPEKNAFKDSKLALQEAVKQFTAARVANPNVPSADFIVMIGDGLHDCYDCGPPPAGPVPFDWNGDKIVNTLDQNAFEGCYSGVTPFASCGWADYNSNGRVSADSVDQAAFYRAFNSPTPVCGGNQQQCSYSFKFYSTGMLQLKNYVRTTVAPMQIPIHVILNGNNIGPHTIDYMQPNTTPARCMTELEKRSAGVTEVLGTLDPTGNPYTCHSVAPSNTIVCDAGADTAFNSMSAANPFYQAAADMYSLAQSTGGYWMPLREPDTGCSADERQDGKCQTGLPRVTLDPQCRTQDRQMQDYITTIMGQSPFSVVQQ